jgi:uncharacterized protein YegJ (DUF2314 family)
MMFLRLLRIAAAGAVLAAVSISGARLDDSPSAFAQEQRAKDETIDFSRDDPEMNAAIKKARSSLVEFWKAFTSPRPGEQAFFLKVAIPYGQNRNEHFWLSNITRDGERLVGTIENDPNYAKHVGRGQRYAFDEDHISDWMFRRNGKIVGAETLRVMLPRMPKDQADGLRAQLEKP